MLIFVFTHESHRWLLKAVSVIMSASVMLYALVTAAIICAKRQRLPRQTPGENMHPCIIPYSSLSDDIVDGVAVIDSVPDIFGAGR